MKRATKRTRRDFYQAEHSNLRRRRRRQRRGRRDITNAPRRGAPRKILTSYHLTLLRHAGYIVRAFYKCEYKFDVSVVLIGSNSYAGEPAHGLVFSRIFSTCLRFLIAHAQRNKLIPIAMRFNERFFRCGLGLARRTSLIKMLFL